MGRFALVLLLAGCLPGQQHSADPEFLLHEGLAAYDRRNLAEAIRLWRKGLEIAAASRDDLFLGSFHGNLGVAYTAAGDYDRAIEHYEASLKLARKAADRAGEKNRLNNLAGLYLLAKRPVQALEAADAGLEIARDLQDVLLEVKLLSNAGQALALLGRPKDGEERFRRALDAAEAGRADLSERQREELEESLDRMRQAMEAQGLTER